MYYTRFIKLSITKINNTYQKKKIVIIVYLCIIIVRYLKDIF